MEWMDRFVKVMNVLSSKQYCRGAGITALSEETEISKSTLHRMLQDMIDHNLVIQQSDTKKYELGPLSMIWGSNFIKGQNVAQILGKYCNVLAKKTNLYSFLCRFSAEQVYCIVTRQPLQEAHTYFVGIGQIMPWHCSACAKAILAYQPPQFIDRVLPQNEKLYTKYTVADPAVLKEQLKKVRQDHIAWCRQEMEVNISAMAVPVFLANHKAVFSLSIVGSNDYIMDNEEYLKKILLAVGEEASRDISLAGTLTAMT
ncbi:IclR family transcriptional regulator [Pectinatus sottacetonis]|uniref:IclR family transcriptional regulator n=1 Tax=Pectinatus sottacetonis TaxID=1002795 RepID=UPI0018C75D7A|nr:IclR family transcriptional regulator [Pectinatus sottacetonis]